MDVVNNGHQFEDTPAVSSYLESESRRRSSRWDLVRERVKLTTTAHVPGGGGTTPKYGRMKRSTAGGAPKQVDQQLTGVEYENTYQLRPDAPFNVLQVRDAIGDILECLLRDQHYDVTRVAKITERITEAVKLRVKSMQFTRHKLVVHAVMGSKSGQGLEIGSRSLWNQATDSSASYCYENKELFAAVTVYGIYYE